MANDGLRKLSKNPPRSPSNRNKHRAQLGFTRDYFNTLFPVADPDLDLSGSGERRGGGGGFVLLALPAILKVSSFFTQNKGGGRGGSPLPPSPVLDLKLCFV